MHDAANSVSTIVSTRVYRPNRLSLGIIFNFIVFLIFGTTVATTIGNGMINISTVTPTVIFAGLLGAICWNMITWFFGLPSSSSHALIGGYGAAIAHAGFGVLILGGWYKTLIFIALAPIIGIILGYFLKVIISWLIRKQSLASVNKLSRQLFSAAAYQPGTRRGTGITKNNGYHHESLLVAGGVISVFKIPLWVSAGRSKRQLPGAPSAAAGVLSRPWDKKSPN